MKIRMSARDRRARSLLANAKRDGDDIDVRAATGRYHALRVLTVIEQMFDELEVWDNRARPRYVDMKWDERPGAYTEAERAELIAATARLAQRVLDITDATPAALALHDPE